jgi:hypothetical protein
VVQGAQTLPAVLDNAIGAKVDNLLQQQIKSQTPNKSAWLLPDSKTSQASPLIVQAAKPTTNKPDQIAPETLTLENKPIQPTTSPMNRPSLMLTFKRTAIPEKHQKQIKHLFGQV